MCINCHLGVEEIILHLVMQYPAQYSRRASMFHEINILPNDIGSKTIQDPTKLLLILLGRSAVDYTIEQMIPIWTIRAQYIRVMYRELICNRREMQLK